MLQNYIRVSLITKIVLLLTVSFSGSAFATETENMPRFERWHQEFGAEIGYGLGINLPNGDRPDIQFAHIAANFQLDLTGNIGSSFYQGNLNWFTELNANLLHNPDSGTLIGFSPTMLQYKFIQAERNWAPTLLIGAGLALTDWDREDIAGNDISGGLQFLLHGGMGIEFFRPGSGSFSINYRLVHISNAGMKRPNVGLNANTFTIGFTF